MKAGAVTVADKAPVPDPTRTTSNEGTTQVPAPSQMLPPPALHPVPCGAGVNAQEPPLHEGASHAVGEWQSAAVLHCVSHAIVSETDVLAAPVQTGPTLPPSSAVPLRFTLSVTVQVVPRAVPHENVAFGCVGFVMRGVPLRHVADQRSVCAPPEPGITTDERLAVSGGRSSAGFIETPWMAGHPKGVWFTTVTDASTATVPLSTTDGRAASVGTVHVTMTTAGTVVPVVTVTGAEEPEHGSPWLSVPVRVTT
ncbi:MAG: hypothetical protein ACRENE_08155 [Polyangiaceae bacterium]